MHQGLGLGDVVFQQLQRQQGGGPIVGGQLLGVPGRFQGGFFLSGGQAHVAQHGPCSGGAGGVVQIGLQGLLDHGGGQLFIAGMAVELGNGQVGGGFAAGWGGGQFLAEGLDRVGDAVEHEQNLQQVAVGQARLGEGLLPRPCRAQSQGAGAGTQGHFGGALVQGLEVGFARRIQEQGHGILGIALGGRHLAQQQFVQQRRIQWDAADFIGRRGIYRGAGRLGAGMPSAEQGGTERE